MNYIFLLIGVLLLIYVIIDLIWTSLWVDGGAGPFTKLVTNLIWNILRKLDKEGNKILRLSGPIILISILLIWVVMLWISWTFIFASFEGGVVNTARKDAITMIDYLYYAGYVLFTLGNGEITPTNGTVQLLTSMASASGMLNLTLAVSYIFSTLDGVVKRRSFASSISGMGTSSIDLVKRSWDGEKFHDSDIIFHSLAEQLSDIAFEQRAYPLLNYYHPSQKEKSITYTLPILYDAINIMEYGAKSKGIVNPLMLKNVRSTIEDYLMSSSKVSEKEFEDSEILPYPNLQPLKEEGIEVFIQNKFEEALVHLKENRSRISNIMAVNWPLEVLK